MSLELLRRAKLKGYGGSKTALYELVQALRPERPRPVVRFEGLAVEFSQHDFGHVDVRYLAAAIVDRILERGRLLHLDGPSMRTKHLGLDAPAHAEAGSQPVVRISVIERSEFPGSPTTSDTALAPVKPSP